MKTIPCTIFSGKEKLEFRVAIATQTTQTRFRITTPETDSVLSTFRLESRATPRNHTVGADEAVNFSDEAAVTMMTSSNGKSSLHFDSPTMTDRRIVCLPFLACVAAASGGEHTGRQHKMRGREDF